LHFDKEQYHHPVRLSQLGLPGYPEVEWNLLPGTFCSIQNKQLKAYLTYGSVKLFHNKYNVNAEDSYEKLKDKIRESSAYYEKKYEWEGAKPE